MNLIKGKINKFKMYKKKLELFSKQSLKTLICEKLLKPFWSQFLKLEIIIVINLIGVDDPCHILIKKKTKKDNKKIGFLKAFPRNVFYWFPHKNVSEESKAMK